MQSPRPRGMLLGTQDRINPKLGKPSTPLRRYPDGWDFDRIFRRLVQLWNEQNEIEREELLQWARVIQLAPDVVDLLKTAEAPE